MLAAGAWAVCRYRDYLVVAWGWIVAAGAGMAVAVTMAACLMISWLAFGELFCRRSVDDWPVV